MDDLQMLKWRVGVWVCFLFGTIWIIWSLLSAKRWVTFDDLYPGIALIGAGIVLRLAIKWMNMEPPFGPPTKKDDEHP